MLLRWILLAYLLPPFPVIYCLATFIFLSYLYERLGLLLGGILSFLLLIFLFLTLLTDRSIPLICHCLSFLYHTVESCGFLPLEWAKMNELSLQSSFSYHYPFP